MATTVKTKETAAPTQGTKISDLTFHQRIAEVQSRLRAPKGQYNSFGKYNYRSCEDILEAVKPLLYTYGLTMQVSDEIVAIGARFYVKATAAIHGEAGESMSNTAYAREDDQKKGMDCSQVTGACSSYARKYALNGLLLIDDNKDFDANESKLQQQSAPVSAPALQPQPALQQLTPEEMEVEYNKAVSAIRDTNSVQELGALYKGLHPCIRSNDNIVNLCRTKREYLEKERNNTL